MKLQDDSLKGTLSSVDIATKENMEKLASTADALLKKPVSRVNLETGHMMPAYHRTEMTNEKALKRSVRLLRLLSVCVLYWHGSTQFKCT